MRNAHKLSLGIALLIAFYSVIFMILMRYEGQLQSTNLITAVYWVMTTITTLGYGDIVFRSQIGRLFSIFVVLSGIFILWAVVLPLMITPRIENLVRTAPSSAPKRPEGHIIISGYSPIVETLTDRLSLLEIPYLIIERREDVAKTIFKSYPTLWGNPSERGVLKRANLSAARLLIANESNELNSEVIMTVREVSEIDVIAIADDLTLSRFLSYAGASRIISPKTLLGTFIAQITSPPKKNSFPGAIQLFGDLRLVELPINPVSELTRKKMTVGSTKFTGANIVGIWRRGSFLPCPGPDEVIQSNSVLMAVGDIEQLSRIRDLTLGPRKEGPLIILGYGDVGRRVAKVLADCGIRPLIVDRHELKDMPFRHITGDATQESNLIEAGIKEAVGVLILLNRDSDAIYATLQAKNLNPNAFVVVRANRVKSVERIYRAGADYVAAVPIVASHMLAKIVQDEQEELDLLYEDLELKHLKITRRSNLVGVSLGDMNLPDRFGVRVVALQREGIATAALDRETVIEEGDELALIGSPEGLEAFNQAYDRRPSLKKMLKFPR
ncbi:MAG: Calcium-gated potassium channel MthK [Methanosaeta sp. PtaU1.Bin060]|nr:MAG: Calcium-gated potassium channel MthK [Methanosaeta sp. PtaU1.Bin060]